eukprot:TRINITY_DN2014_c0_g1_i1.p1 TRINITY_DN2014_c0_g1~~TRINITY_DN2014_c0_g1_i1.p1  ORF type:complete len:221 (+),score=35.90 TRINITY_DN2014_c0_g1_i1:124-786(+)
MSLAIFSTKNNYHKNGIWWFTKILNRVIGESRYDTLRIQRRIIQAKIWYTRQQFLYEMYVDYPEMAALLGVYPKVDSSHGFPWPFPYEMYRDFQENTINSDGWFGMWIFWLCFIYVLHTMYNYMLPYYWLWTPVQNGEYIRYRMRDAIGSTVIEELYGNQWMEIAYTPHDFHYQRARGMWGYSHPDDPRVMHMSTFNRKNKYREHYLHRVGDSGSMIQPL